MDIDESVLDEVLEDQAEQPDAEPAEEPSEAEPEVEGDEEDEQPAIDTVAVEIDGQTYEVPKALEDKFLMQSDYTKKTQEVAEARRALEAEQETFKAQSAAHTAHLEDLAAVKSIDQQLEKYKQVDWARLEDEDPEQAQRAFRQYSLLRDHREEAVSRLQQREVEHSQTAQQEFAKRLEQARSYAQREIPNWSADTENKLQEFTSKHGIDADLVRQAAASNPATLKILNLAYLGEQFLEKQRKPKPKLVKPVPKVKGGGSPPAGPRDDMPMDDWVRAERQRLARKERA